MGEGNGPETLRFEFAEGDLEVEKEMTLSPRGLPRRRSRPRSARRAAAPGPRLLWGPGVGNPTAAEREVQGYQAPQGVALGGGEVRAFPAAKLAPDRQALGPVRWAGVESHYFVALFVPPGGTGRCHLRAGDPRPPTRTASRTWCPWWASTSASRKRARAPLRGPKDYQEMARAGPPAARLVVVPVGDWIGPIVVPLMGLLRLGARPRGQLRLVDRGADVLINLVMAPFRHYSIANGLKMAKISPEMKVIQERYRKVPAHGPEAPGDAGGDGARSTPNTA